MRVNLVKVSLSSSSLKAKNVASKQTYVSPKVSVREMLAGLRALKQEHQKLRGAYRVALTKTLSAVCACAARLAANEKLFAEFIRDSFWVENPKRAPRVNDRQDALKFLLRYHCGAGTAASKRANKYWTHLSSLGNLGFVAANWETAINNAGGITALPRAAANLSSRPASDNRKAMKKRNRTHSKADDAENATQPSDDQCTLPIVGDLKKIQKATRQAHGTFFNLRIQVISAEGSVSYRLDRIELE